MKKNASASFPCASCGHPKEYHFNGAMPTPYYPEWMQRCSAGNYDFAHGGRFTGEGCTCTRYTTTRERV